MRCPGPPGSCSPVRPLGVLFCVCGVLGFLAPVHRCARSVCCFACAVSWASWLLFTGLPARCVVLRVWYPGPPGSCSPVRPLGVLCCVCAVLGLLAPVHRCARSVCCVTCAVSWASWLLFTLAPARCVVLRVRCPGPPGSCSPVRPLGVLFCVCGVLGLLAPVHRCAHSVCCFASAVSWASWLLFTGAHAQCVVLRVWYPGPPGSCSPVRPLGVLCCVCAILGLLAPVHRCARSVCCVTCAVSWASWLLFTGAPARCVVLRVRCPGPPGSCSTVCPLGVLFCVCGVLGLLAPVHPCARSVCCFACAVSVGLLAPVHRCARSVCCFACAPSWASWLLFTGVPARCVVLRVRCPGPLGSCSPVRPLGVLCCVCGVLGHLAPVHRCARAVCCVACAVSWASWLLFTGAPARCVVLRVRCPGPPGSCSPVCPRGVLCCVCGVLGHLAPVHRCARAVCCVASAVSWASWLLFTGAPARCVVLRGRCPGSLGSCSPVCPRGVLCCVCGVLGPLAPVHRCARSVCCVACAVSWASWLLFIGVPAWCVVLRVRCPGPLGSCSPVSAPVVLCRACGVLGPLAPVHPCARSVGCVVCTVSSTAWLLFTAVFALCFVPWVARGVLLCGASLRGAHSSIRTAAARSRQGLGSPQAHTRPSGRRLFVAGRGWVPSGRALVHPDGGWRACACSLWPGRAGRPPGRVVVRLTFSSGRFVFLRCLAPSGLWWPPSSSLLLPFLVALRSFVFCFFFFFFFPLLPRAPVVYGFLRFLAPGALGLGAMFWLFFLASRCLALRALSPRLCLPLGRWLLSAGSCPAPPSPFVPRGFRRSCWVPWCFFFLFFSFFLFFLRAPPLSPAFSGFRPRVPRASALCVVCFVGLPLLGSPCDFPSSMLSAWPLAAPWWLLPPAPPPLCVSRFSLLPLAAVCRVLCCAVCPWVRCCAALLRVVSPGVVLSCAVLLCCARLVPLLIAPCPLALLVALGSCALRRFVLRCSPALCALCCVCFVVARWCVLLFAALLCAVCVPGCCAVRSLSSPLCAVLCFAVLVRSRCAVRVVRAVAGAGCCGALLCVVLCPLVCRGAALGLVARGCLLVACFGVGVPVWPRGLLPCGWCGLLWCPAFLCRVLCCCAVAWCCAVVLCCRVAMLLGLALPSCGLSCCAVLCCWLAVLFFARWWCLRAVVLFPSCCAFPVFSALCAAVPCCAGCGALLPCVVCCGAVLSCGAVLLCSAVALRCCLCLLCPPAACRAAPCCAVLCCWLSVLFFARGWRLCAVVPFPYLPARTKKHQSSYMSPRVGGGVVAGMPWWLRYPRLDAAHVPPAVKGR